MDLSDDEVHVYHDESRDLQRYVLCFRHHHLNSVISDSGRLIPQHQYALALTYALDNSKAYLMTLILFDTVLVYLFY